MVGTTGLTVETEMLAGVTVGWDSERPKRASMSRSSLLRFHISTLATLSSKVSVSSTSRPASALSSQPSKKAFERAEKAGTATEGDSTASTGVAIGDETSTVPMVEWDMATIESLLLVSGIGSQGIGVNSS